MLHQGDCLAVMAGLAEASVDAVVTDPPYGLGFMGREWDVFAPARVAREDASRQRKTTVRTSERWPDRIGRSQGGTPIVYDESPAGHMRFQEWSELWAREALRVTSPGGYLLSFGGTRTVHRLACAIEDAGWTLRDTLIWVFASGFPKSRATLKPSWEPIVMARKPGPLRELAIDACRIPFAGPADEAESKDKNRHGDSKPRGRGVAYGADDRAQENYDAAGRWPSNVVLTDAVFDGDAEGVVGGGMASAGASWERRERGIGPGILEGQTQTGRVQLEPTTYSRFFLVPKADRSEREPLIASSGPLAADYLARRGGERVRLNIHPTVKPIELMRHLVRLVTPRGGDSPRSVPGLGHHGDRG